MYVVLTQDVPQVGQKNALIDVTEGYFMNYLFPRSLARAASTNTLQEMKQHILEQKQSAAHAAKSEMEHAAQLQGKKLTVVGKASDKGTLFKAITEKDVVALIKKNFKIDVPASAVEMEHFKKLGDHSIGVKMGSQNVQMTLTIQAEEA